MYVFFGVNGAYILGKLLILNYTQSPKYKNVLYVH